MVYTNTQQWIAINDNIDGYRKTVDYLETNKAEFYTFQMKSERKFRVVVRGLHPSCDTKLMMEEISELGFKPAQMIPVFHPND
mgnify:CR=1 FL=1